MQTEEAGVLRIVSEFRDLMSTFPTGIAVVTAKTDCGTPVGATCSSLTSVSLSPPLLLICLKPGRTLDAITRTGAFAVNLLRASARGTAELFSSAEPDKFAKVHWRDWGENGMPRLTQDAFAFASCRLDRALPAGDHIVVFGAVEEIRTSTGVPLLYGLRRYSSWPIAG